MRMLVCVAAGLVLYAFPPLGALAVLVLLVLTGTGRSRA